MVPGCQRAGKESFTGERKDDPDDLGHATVSYAANAECQMPNQCRMPNAESMPNAE
jgi:hypothetical protein